MTQPTPATVASALTTDKTHLPAASLSRVTSKTRNRAAERGEAMKDGSFPIRDGADLKRAIAAFGRAKDKGAAKRHIIRRAKALDKVDALPASWKALALKEFPGQRPVAEPELTKEEQEFQDELLRAMTEPIGKVDETAALAAKVERHNLVASADRQVSLAKLKIVYRRGVADFGSRTCVTPDQHGHARVNAFLTLLASGAPLSPTYTADNDLLPQGHPASPPFGAVPPYRSRA